MSFKEKVVLITGASRGIGRAIAIELGKRGAIIAGTATTEEGALHIQQTLQAEGIEGKAYAVDVRDEAGLVKTLMALQADYTAPHILVNNAGITRDNLLLRMKREQWDPVIDTNLNAVFRLTKLCLKPMVKAHWGRIINITSVVGVTGNAGQANYVAAKAGLIGFSKSAAQELAGYGITVNCVAPGFIETDMTLSLSEKQQEAILSSIPTKRMGKPLEVAYAVAFLASEEAAYITGETLHVNGGMCMV